MFDRTSLRVVAGALLWSVGAIFLAIAAHGRKHGVSLYSEDVEYVRSLLRGMIAAAFFGVFFGGTINAVKNPLYPNLFGAVVGGVFAWLAPNFAPRLFPTSWPEWIGSVLFIAIGTIAGAFIGILIRKRRETG